MSKENEEDREPEPLLVLHLYREDDGTFLVSEQRFHNHSIDPTSSPQEAFRAFWEICTDQLDSLERNAYRLGWSLTEELAYLRKLAEMGVIERRKHRKKHRKKHKKMRRNGV